MRKLLNKPWFAVLLAVAAIALVANALIPRGDNAGTGVFGGSDPTPAADAAASELIPTTTAAVLKALPIPRLVRDPFALRPVKVEVAEKEHEPDLLDTIHLSAIWSQDGQTLLLINDQICQGGDQVGRIKIESATQDGVWLSHWRGRDFISIGGNFTLNTPAAQLPAVANSL